MKTANMYKKMMDGIYENSQCKASWETIIIIIIIVQSNILGA